LQKSSTDSGIRRSANESPCAEPSSLGRDAGVRSWAYCLAVAAVSNVAYLGALVHSLYPRSRACTGCWCTAFDHLKRACAGCWCKAFDHVKKSLYRVRWCTAFDHVDTACSVAKLSTMLNGLQYRVRLSLVQSLWPGPSRRGGPGRRTVAKALSSPPDPKQRRLCFCATSMRLADFKILL